MIGPRSGMGLAATVADGGIYVSGGVILLIVVVLLLVLIFRGR